MTFILEKEIIEARKLIYYFSFKTLKISMFAAYLQKP